MGDWGAGVKLCYGGAHTASLCSRLSKPVVWSFFSGAMGLDLGLGVETVAEHWKSLTMNHEKRAFLLASKMKVLAARRPDGNLSMVMELHDVHVNCDVSGCPDCAEAAGIMDQLGFIHEQLVSLPNTRHLIDTGLPRHIYEEMLPTGADIDSQKAKNLAHWFTARLRNYRARAPPAPSALWRTRRGSSGQGIRAANNVR